MSYRPIVTVTPPGFFGRTFRVEYRCHSDVSKMYQPSITKQPKGDTKTVIMFEARGDDKPYLHETKPIPNEEARRMEISNGSTDGNRYTMKISGADPTKYFQ